MASKVLVEMDEAREAYVALRSQYFVIEAFQGHVTPPPKILDHDAMAAISRLKEEWNQKERAWRESLTSR